MVIAMSIISAVIAVGVPAALAIYSNRRFKASWTIIMYGAIAFIVAYFLNSFLLSLVQPLITSGEYPWMSTGWFNILFPITGGLLAGFLEQGANWLALKISGDMGKSWSSALGLGVGHGGMESIYAVGIPLLLTVFQVFSLQKNGIASLNLSEPEAASLQESLDAFYATPWHLPLAIGVDRLLAFVPQITASILTWLAFRKRGWYWFLAAIGLQALAFCTASFLGGNDASIWIAEAVLLVIAAASAYILYLVKTRIIDKDPELLMESAVPAKAPVKPVLDLKSEPLSSKPLIPRAPKPKPVLTKKSTSKKPAPKKK